MLYFLVEIHMENQMNVENQNTQQIGQNPINEPVLVPEKPKVNYWMISTLVLFLALVFSGICILSLRNRATSLTNQPSISKNEPITTPIPSPQVSSPVVEPISVPETNTLYLGTYNGKEVVFLLTEQKANSNIGWLQTSESGADTAFDFKKLQNPKKIFSSSKKIHSINSFALNQSKTVAYVVVNYGVDLNGPQPGLTNTIIQTKLNTMTTSEIWSNEIGSKKYEGGGGAAYLDMVVGDKFLTFWIASCYACEGGPAGTVVLNINSKREKYFQDIGNIQFEIASNTFSYQKLAPFQEPCDPSPGCDNGQRTVMKPTGQIFTENLP